MSQNDNNDPWQKPGNSGNSGNGKKDNSPPDLEEVFSDFLNKLRGSRTQNNGSGNNNQEPPRNNNNGGSIKITLPNLKIILPLILAVLVVIWAATGFYTVKEAERGVVTRLGAMHKIVLPGLNWKPNFIDQVTKVNIERISELKTHGSMLTQDENMVSVEMTVQYRIDDSAKYLFAVTEPDETLKQATDSALRYVIGHMTMNDILTTGRAVVREKTWKELNNIIKSYDMGLLVTDVNFQYARPPEEVKDAFDDAIKAQEDEQRLIREAEAYARGQEPIARGNAQRIIEQADAYKQQVVLQARGEAARFEALLPEYKLAPEVTKKRLYLDTMQKVMANTPKVLLENGNNVSLLPLDKLLGSQKTVTKEPLDFDTQSKGGVLQQKVEPQRLDIRIHNDSADSSRKGRFN